VDNQEEVLSGIPGRTRITTQKAVCEKHGEYEQEGSDFGIFGVRFLTGCPECLREGREEEERQAIENERQARITRLEGLGIRRRFYEATFDSYIATNDGQRRALEVCLDYAKRKGEVVETGESLFLIGLPGTGKNHLAVSILREWGKGRIVKLSEMVREIRLSYSDGSSEQGRIESFARMPLLILNEVGVQRGTDAERNLVFEVLDMRYENMLPTVLISNLNIQGIKDFIGGRVIDRLMECAQVVEFTWDSYRGNSK